MRTLEARAAAAVAQAGRLQEDLERGAGRLGGMWCGGAVVLAACDDVAQGGELDTSGWVDRGGGGR